MYRYIDRGIVNDTLAGLDPRFKAALLRYIKRNSDRIISIQCNVRWANEAVGVIRGLIRVYMKGHWKDNGQWPIEDYFILCSDSLRIMDWAAEGYSFLNEYYCAVTSFTTFDYNGENMERYTAEEMVYILTT